MTSQNPVWLRTTKQSHELRKDAEGRRKESEKPAYQTHAYDRAEKAGGQGCYGSGHDMKHHGEGKEYGDK